MPKKKSKFPSKLIVVRTSDFDDDDVMICHETPEDIDEEFADQPVAVYELVALGTFTVDKQVDAKLVKPR